MLPAESGSFRLFTFSGINVYLHWSWLVFAMIATQASGRYHHPAWPVVEYLGLFAIVLAHEFGHALACRSVGGKAERIVLWPLGGVAFVQPPPRPGAVLWSIAAGPLVNVGLVPGTVLFYRWASSVSGGGAFAADLQEFALGMLVINTGLLLFNLLPIYPLDGGQILQSLLWFVIGRSKSLRIVATVGMVTGVAAGAAAAYGRDVWLVVLAVFVVMRAWHGYKVARMMSAIEAEHGVRF